MTFHQFLERRGFHANACEALEHPDFYALTESLWKALEEIAHPAHGNDVLAVAARETLKGR